MTTALAAVALVLGVARLAMFIALHLVPSDYNIVQHAVSDYAVGPTRRLATTITWTSAVSWTWCRCRAYQHCDWERPQYCDLGCP